LLIKFPKITTRSADTNKPAWCV